MHEKFWDEKEEDAIQVQQRKQIDKILHSLIK
jgi:hypothetical protein